MMVICLSELLLFCKDKQLIIPNPKHFIVTIKIHSTFHFHCLYLSQVLITSLFTLQRTTVPTANYIIATFHVLTHLDVASHSYMIANISIKRIDRVNLATTPPCWPQDGTFCINKLWETELHLFHCHILSSRQYNFNKSGKKPLVMLVYVSKMHLSTVGCSLCAFIWIYDKCSVCLFLA